MEKEKQGYASNKRSWKGKKSGRESVRKPVIKLALKVYGFALVSVESKKAQKEHSFTVEGRLICNLS